MALYVLITGFGPPHWDHKLQILENNLQKITNYPWTTCDIHLCQYVSPRDYQIPKSLQDQYRLTIHYNPGIVGEFILKHAQPETLTHYDYVLLLLDDIELQDFHIPTLLKYIHQFNLDIISPSLTQDSKYQYDYLLSTNYTFHLKITNVCEYFCMLFKRESFTNYYNAILPENPWMWGLDLILHKHLKLNVGIANQILMKHWYKNDSYASRTDFNPAEGFHKQIKLYNETPDSLAMQKAVRYFVVDCE